MSRIGGGSCCRMAAGSGGIGSGWGCGGGPGIAMVMGGIGRSRSPGRRTPNGSWCWCGRICCAGRMWIRGCRGGACVPMPGCGWRRSRCGTRPVAVMTANCGTAPVDLLQSFSHSRVNMRRVNCWAGSQQLSPYVRAATNPGLKEVPAAGISVSAGRGLRPSAASVQAVSLDEPSATSRCAVRRPSRCAARPRQPPTRRSCRSSR